MHKFIGNGREIEFDNEKVTFRQTQSLIGKLDQNVGHLGTHTVAIADVVSVDVKKASVYSNGYIKIIANGGNQNDNDNTVYFFSKKGIDEQANEFVNLLQEAIKSNKKTNNNINISPADEIKKFKELLDCGAITQEEYDTKKKELLGL